MPPQRRSQRFNDLLDELEEGALAFHDAVDPYLPPTPEGQTVRLLGAAMLATIGTIWREASVLDDAFRIIGPVAQAGPSTEKVRRGVGSLVATMTVVAALEPVVVETALALKRPILDRAGRRVVAEGHGEQPTPDGDRVASGWLCHE